MSLKWVNTVVTKKWKRKLKVILGYMEIRSNTVVVTMIENQVSYSDGPIHHTTWIKLMTTLDSSSKISNLKKDAFRSSRKMKPVNKSLQRTIMSMKLINLTAFIVATSLTKNLRTLGASTTFQSTIELKRSYQDSPTDISFKACHA